jgi:hypothetical protein
MNFVKNQKDIQNLLKTDNGRSYSGIYCYSPAQKDKTFKLGMSERGIFRRLTQHKACYPFASEYWLQLVVIILDEETGKTRKLEKKILEETKEMKTISVEEAKQEQGNRPREYRLFGNRSKVNFAFEKVLNKKENRGLWDYVVVFSENGWHVIPNIKIENRKPITSSSLLSPKSKRYRKRLSLTVQKELPYNQSEITLTGKKKGDVIMTKWGPMTITYIISKKKIKGKWAEYDGEYILNLSK